MESTRILVVFTTKHGSTGEIAETIGDVLREAGLEVVCTPIATAPSPAGYDGVVVGSPVYMGKCLPATVEYVRKYAKFLNGIACAAFLVGYTPRTRTEKHLQIVEAALRPIRDQINLRDAGIFAGRVIPERLSFIDRSILRLGGMDAGDFRNWEEIRTWAQGLVGLWMEGNSSG